MRASLQSTSGVTTLSYLPFCHYTSSLSLLNSPSSLSLLPPSTTKYLSRRNSISLLNYQKKVNIVYTASAGSSIRALSMASSTQNQDASKETKPFSVLFVCLGNICRSPAAEAVFRGVVKKRGLDSKFNIDSAGTIGYHEGNLADPRMRAASKRRGIEITSLSRPIRSSDFKDFDLILAMDKRNREDILRALNSWKLRETFPADADKKVKLMCSYCKNHDDTEVPDPYYGGPEGFEKVLDLLEDACESLLETILADHGHV